jgi:hypothetical protein
VKILTLGTEKHASKRSDLLIVSVLLLMILRFLFYIVSYESSQLSLICSRGYIVPRLIIAISQSLLFTEQVAAQRQKIDDEEYTASN